MTEDRPDGTGHAPVSPTLAGLSCRCPRCGKGRLFEGFLTLRQRCEVCGLDYGFADPADGPAFFVLLVGCVPSLLFGVWLEVAFTPPIWVHAVVTLPIILVSCIAPLRPLKGWLIASQYRFGAGEGRVAPRPSDRTGP